MPFASQSQRSRWLVALVLGLSVLAVGLLWWQASRSQDRLQAELLRQAEQRSLLLADAMAGQVEAQLNIIDLELLELRREWLRGEGDFDEVVRSVLSALPRGFVSHVTVADGTGRVVYDTRNPATSRPDNVADQAYFQTARSGGDRFHIAKPAREASGEDWTFVASRPMLRDGRFDGVVALAISSGYMASRLAALRLSDTDVVTLIYPDGAFVARSLDNANAMGQSVPADRPFLTDRSAPKGHFRVKGLVDGLSRTYGWHRLPTADLIVGVGLSDSEALAPLAPGLRTARSTAAFFGVLLLLAGGLIAFLMARVARDQAAVAANLTLRTRLFDSSHVPKVVLDPRTGQFIDCNSAAVKAYGLSRREDVLGKNPLQVSAALQYGGKSSEELGRTILSRILSGEALVFDWLHQRPNGETWDAEVHLMGFEADGRKLLQFTLIDITDRKRAEARLRESEARLKEAQRLARVGSWELDLVSNGLTWSDEIFRILELDPGTCTPAFKSFILRVHPDDRDLLKREYEASYNLRRSYDLVHRLLLPDGRVKHVRETGFTDFDGDRALRSVGTLQDITEVREAQDALQRLNEELESRVAERTRELSLLNRELDAFAYSVSHDLRTPLRSINGYAAVLVEDFADSLPMDARQHLERIRAQAARMGQLITDLLALARLTQADLNVQRVDLSAMARAIVAELSQTDPARRVHWSIEDGVEACADPVLIRAALLNLLANAWKYTARVPEAHIVFSHRIEPDGSVHCCVQDNGAGFDMRYASHLFAPFKRLHAHHEFEGSGVGLATVRRVIERHRGSVRGEGVVGLGATFCFTLPRVSGLTPAHADPSKPLAQHLEV